MSKEILVHDDEDDFVQRYSRQLENLDILSQDFSIVPLYKKQFVEQMEILCNRQRALRKNETLPSNSRLDEVAIFVVDFDLIESDPKAEWTSEDVAYLVRCFSRCGLVIGMNLKACPEFDLTLKGHLGSYADLNIVAKQLDNIRLWSGNAERDKFRPWYWPPLLRLLRQFDIRVRDVDDHFNEPICDVLGIHDIATVLPKSVSQFLGGDDPLKTTFEDFVVHSPIGLRAKEKNLSRDAMCRVAAARISKWFERSVLPGQDILVDAPHLVMRYPSLLEGDHSIVETWNKTASFSEFDDLPLKHSLIENYRFTRSDWISRPVWFWSRLAECENIREVITPWEKEHPKYVFCEDASMFYERELCEEFDAEVDSPYVRRYVRHFESIDYQPVLRLL